MALALAVAGWRLSLGRLDGLLFLAAAGVLLLGHFLHGTVHAALRAHRQGDSATAHRLLAAVKHPERLTPQDRAYFHFLRGLLLAEKGQLEAAVPELEEALRRVRRPHEKSVVHCKLAELALSQGDRVNAHRHLQGAEESAPPPSVGELIREMKTALAQSEGEGMESGITVQV